MTTDLWQPADAARLKWLREQVNLSTNEFARMHSISIHQLAQLEKDGHDTFYSPIIKYHLGKKLLNVLAEKTKAEGHVELLDETIHASEPLGQVKLNQKGHALAMLDKIADVSNRDYDPPFYKAVMQSLYVCWKEHAFVSRLVVFLFVIWVGMRYVNEPWLALKKAYLSDDAVVVVEVIANNADVKAANVASTVISAPINEVTSQSMAKADVKAAASDLWIPTPSKDCRWSETPVTLTSSPPSKPASYVYLMAIQDITACVMGQDQHITTHVLKAGENQTVNGIAPFRIYSDRLADLKIFFHGRRVTLPDQNVRDVLLVESISSQ